MLVTTAVVLGLTAGTALAATHAETGNAGELPGTAQQPGGTPTDPLTEITGNISTNNDVDMYRICLTGNSTFSATTNTNPPFSR